ncbi:hypothetical protein [Tabrizicola caldifontis]|uniref:hypothetical protein n=1 Tax=Tabrizicola caldifontis TaxID=2528036 RepID=UPI0010819E9A|nr:hypothetical protein [Rhodobacter sp. YIM 73028]
MALALSLMMAQAACVATAPQTVPVAASGPVRVTKNGQPFAMWEGAVARKFADAQCGPRGVRSTIYDRYDRVTGEWVYPGGFA